ncbi:MAG: hemolysin family protein [Anaerolineae bacterium]
MEDPNSSSIWFPIAALVFFLLLTSLASAAETALTSLNRVQLRALVNRGVPWSTAIESLLEDPRRSMVTLLILNGLGLIGSASAATLLVPHLAQTGWLKFVILLAVALLLVAMAQIVPKSWAASRPEHVALVVAGPVGLLTSPLWPVVRLFDLLSRGVSRLAGGEAQPIDQGLMMSEEELRLLVGAGEDEGLIEDEEKEMIAGIFELGKTLAREVMVPRISVVAVDVDTPLLEALDVIIEAGHSRIPVYHDSIDNIVGILYAKDLLNYFRDGQVDVPLCDIVRDAYFIPESKHVDDLLQELQERKVHIVIVVDEYGGTAGLVTIEDLIEEIVGEIQDEYDREEPVMEQVSEDEIIFNARIDLDDVNRLMSLNLPTEHGDTLGGLVFSQLGKIPVQGDRVRIDGVTIEVLSVVGRRIKKVRVVRDHGGRETANGSGIELRQTEGRNHRGLIKDAAV